MSQKSKGVQYRIHVTNTDSVWYAIDQTTMPIPVGMNTQTFIDNNPIKPEDEVVMLGSRDNAKLLIHLYQSKLYSKLHSLKVCSPVVCKGEKRRQDPKIILMDMMQAKDLPGSLGGWHEFYETDYFAYTLASQNFEDVEAIKDYSSTHPAWPYLQFIPHLNPIKCAQLLGGLIDPRWYVDPENPDSHSRLEGYLGLNPKVQQMLSSDSDNKAYVYERCKLVLEAWKTKPPTEEQLEEPKYFLWRIHDNETDETMADLRASQTFMTYLRETWLHAIYRTNGGVSKEGLFAPDIFFNHISEVNAYKDYISEVER
jgi:hypothetical protein